MVKKLEMNDLSEAGNSKRVTIAGEPYIVIKSETGKGLDFRIDGTVNTLFKLSTKKSLADLTIDDLADDLVKHKKEIFPNDYRANLFDSPKSIIISLVDLFIPTLHASEIENELKTQGEHDYLTYGLTGVALLVSIIPLAGLAYSTIRGGPGNPMIDNINRLGKKKELAARFIKASLLIVESAFYIKMTTLIDKKIAKFKGMQKEYENINLSI